MFLEMVILSPKYGDHFNLWSTRNYIQIKGETEGRELMINENDTRVELALACWVLETLRGTLILIKAWIL